MQYGATIFLLRKLIDTDTAHSSQSETVQCPNRPKKKFPNPL